MPPPQIGSRSARPGVQIGVFAALIAAAGLIAFGISLDRLVLSPGPAVPIADRIEFVDHPEDELSGRLLLTTVRISEADPIDAARAWFDEHREVVAQDLVIPDDRSRAEYFRAQREVFVESGQVAVAVGLRAAGLTVAVSGDGARVLGVVPGSPAQDRLAVGDVVTAVGDEPVSLASDLSAALAELAVTDTATLTVLRDERTIEVAVPLARIGRFEMVGLGVVVNTVDRAVELPFEVDLNAGQIGGPSAGLMIALTVYDLAEDGDLTGGRVIAGTGTINPAGEVGPVGGVEQKVIGALAAGAQIFLAPAAEAETARNTADGRLKVVEINTITEAIAALTDGDIDGE